MTVFDGNFEAFITNLGKYNEGELVGEWVKFPTTKEELTKVFERIGIGTEDEFGNPYEEWFITDYDCPVSEIYDMLGEYENLDKLNYFASLVEELASYDQEKFISILASGCSNISDIDDLINLTFNLDTYGFLYDVDCDSDLGYYHAHETGIYNEKEFGILANYIDYESLGRDIRLDEGGQFTDKGYVYPLGEDWSIEFDGLRESVPKEYRVTGFEGEIENNKTMTILVIEPEKEPYVKEIKTGLAAMQNEVGGSIEMVYTFEDPIGIVCNEEGKLMGFPLNRALRDNDGDIYDIIAGKFIVVGLTEDNVGSLNEEQIKQYTERFKSPEQFIKFGEEIIAIPIRMREEHDMEKGNASDLQRKTSVKDKLKSAKEKTMDVTKNIHPKDKDDHER